jgi:hypothetical protein
MTPKTPQQLARGRFLAALRTMPDEAFSWLISSCAPSMHLGRPQVWPDGVGGFQQASREAIAEAQAAAEAYLAGGA